MSSKSSFTKSEILFYVFLFIGIMLFQNLYCFANVSGSSMKPTYNSGDYLFVSEVSDIKQGDVVIIKKNGIDEFLVKRVIATSDDKIDLVDSKVFINDKLLSEDYINKEEVPVYYGHSTVISANSYFVMGDNRNHSRDSREFGEVTKSEIIGVVKFNLTSLGINLVEIRLCLFLSLLLFIVVYIRYKHRKASI